LALRTVDLDNGHECGMPDPATRMFAARKKLVASVAARDSYMMMGVPARTTQ